MVERLFRAPRVAEPLGSQCLGVSGPLLCPQYILNIWYYGTLGCTGPKARTQTEEIPSLSPCYWQCCEPDTDPESLEAIMIVKV